MRMLTAAIAATLVMTGCASTGTNQGAAGPSSVLPGAPGSGSAGPTGEAGGSGGGSGQPSASPPVSRLDSRCPARLDEGQHNATDGKPVPADITVSWVLRCRVAPQPGGSRYLLVERSDSNPNALLTALRTPDEPLSKGACPMIAVVVPYFVLVRPNGSGLLPHIPVTGCRLPQPPVLQALNALQFTVIARHKMP